MKTPRPEFLAALRIWPEMPDLKPPDLTEVWDNPAAEWTVRVPWLGPPLDGSATLLLPGFRTDGGSIPRAAWRVVGHPFQLPCLAYFLCHDADYAAELRPRRECDDRLLAGMRLDGHVPADKRFAIHRAVRRFGLRPWARHTAAGVAAARRLCRAVFEEEWIALREERGRMKGQKV